MHHTPCLHTITTHHTPLQERDLEELLDMFAMGIGDVEEFQARLQDEFSALEVGCWQLLWCLRGGG